MLFGEKYAIFALLNPTSLKQFIVILLSVILLLPSFGNVFVYAKFKINQDEISKTICIQRKLVNNSCNGRCELQKSLKKFEDNEKKMTNHLKGKPELVYVLNVLESSVFIIPTFSVTNNYFTFDNKTNSVSLSNFRPPAFFV